MLENKDQLKKLAGEEAVKYLKDGMTIGLGSGSTVYWTIKKLGELVQQGLNIKGIPSSRRTEGWANEFGLPLTTFSEVQQLDVAIDGADEIDPHFNLTKGGGGSLVREKIVNAASSQLIIIVDDSKLVSQLGKFPLPVEVVPFGWEVTALNIAKLGCKPKLRMKEDEVFISDNGNYLLDCQFESIPSPKELHKRLKYLLGVVETGLFVDMTNIVIVGKTDGVKILLNN